MYTNPILSEMVALNADGVDFIDPFHQNNLATYPKKAWQVAYGVSYPRTSYKFWKIIDGYKQYITERVDEKVFTIQDDDGYIICACSSLADAQEMIYEFAKEDAYEAFLFDTAYSNDITAEEFWESADRDTARRNEILKHRKPLTTYWNLVDLACDHYYISENVTYFD
jgi:hypothetical protein